RTTGQGPASKQRIEASHRKTSVKLRSKCDPTRGRARMLKETLYGLRLAFPVPDPLRFEIAVGSETMHDELSARADMDPLGRAFPRLVCHGEGWWAATSRSGLHRKPRWFAEFEDFEAVVLGDEWSLLDYFVPTPFMTKERKYEALSDLVSVVRVDLDPPGDKG